MRIDSEAFSECHSLRSFYLPRSIEIIGENCFKKCHYLRRLQFSSGEFLNKLVGDSRLDEVLETLGLSEITSLLKIELEESETQIGFTGWSSTGDGSSFLTLVQDTE
jgi:hypothetical protein